MEDKAIVYQSVSLMDRYYSQKNLIVKAQSDCHLTGYTSLFMASKNSEVEPLSLKDVRGHFLNKTYSYNEILQKEKDIRDATRYENEVSTLFDFVMLYMKIWKLACQRRINDKNRFYSSTYKFICDVETVTYDYTKSVLIDSESTKYKPSIIVASLVCVAIEVSLKLMIKSKTDPLSKKEEKNLPVL